MNGWWLSSVALTNKPPLHDLAALSNVVDRRLARTSRFLARRLAASIEAGGFRRRWYRGSLRAGSWIGESDSRFLERWRRRRALRRKRDVPLSNEAVRGLVRSLVLIADRERGGIGEAERALAKLPPDLVASVRAEVRSSHD